MSAERPLIVLLGDRSPPTAAVFHGLRASLGAPAEVRAILEEHPSRMELARRRARRLGWPKVAGQVTFVALVMPVLRLHGRRRMLDIVREHGLDVGPVHGAAQVRSVNDPQTAALLRTWEPDVVVVHGTRIIARHVLDGISAPMLNLHSGITPRYRGVHGGYWALREGKPDLVGSTVHLLDAGIDTGGILGQATFAPEPRDSIATYPLLHLAYGLPLLAEQVDAILHGATPAAAAPLPGAEASRLRWHPTAWDYLVARARHGVR